MNKYTCSECGKKFSRSGTPTIPCPWCGGMAGTEEAITTPPAGRFTRMHMEAIAKTLRSLPPRAGRRQVICALSSMLAHDNPRFDPERFEQACNQPGFGKRKK